MGKTGILLETDKGEVKAANYGVITAARETGDNEIVGFGDLAFENSQHLCSALWIGSKP